METCLRNSAIAPAEFSGRQQATWQCCELLRTSRRCFPRPCAGRQATRHGLRPRKLPHLLDGTRQQASATAERLVAVSAAALSDAAAAFPGGASPGTSAAVSTVTVEPLPQAAQGASAVATSAAASHAAMDGGASHSATAVVENGVDWSPDTALSVYSSFEELGALSSTSLDYDSDGPEMCALVADPSGDVQVVCESDPTHPLSLAEAAVFNPPLSPTLLQDIETKLEADLTTVAVTILFAVGFISLEFGVNDLIEHYFGDSIFSDIVCAFLGLVVVFWVRLSKVRLMRFDRWR